jgi:peptidylamidoglycolate lyase
MNRGKFIRNVSLTTAGFFIAKDMLANKKGPVYGHNGMLYSMDTKWSKADPIKTPVNDCHEMVQDAKGRIILLTNETKNNILIFSTSGKLLSSWGHEFPGGHGLTLADENGTEYLFVTDTSKNQVYKTTMDGKVLLTINAPFEAGIYKDKKEFVPTEVAVDDTTGDFFIADGYGAQYVLHYDSSGKLKGYFGGRGEGDKFLDNAHGICIDRRNGTPTLLVTDRTRNCFKRYDMQGQLQDIIRVPGACVCRPVIRNQHLYAAVLRSPDISKEGTGFVTILDKNNKVVSNLGGTEPVYVDGKLNTLNQAEKIFVHPHDVCVDRDDNIYVAQWASGKVYPYKFIRK